LRYAKALRLLKISHKRTKPYTPQTTSLRRKAMAGKDGKAERFVQTSLREWAYARVYNSSHDRAAHPCIASLLWASVILIKVNRPSSYRDT